MSPRGANLRKGSPQRALDDKKIRDRWLRKTGQLEPEPEPQPALEEPVENSAMHPTKAEREKAVFAWREIRRQWWERPLVAADGSFVARALPDDYVLPWEDVDEILERELPTYADWRLEDSEIGLLLIGPGRIPQLVDPAELLQPPDESAPEPELDPEPIELVEIDGAVVVAPNSDDPMAA